MKNLLCPLTLSSILLGLLSPGCEDLGVPPHILPSVISFSAGPRNISQGQSVKFKVYAAAELGLARGIIDFRDGTKRDTVNLSGTRDSAQTSHVYLVPGIFKPTLTLEDVPGRRAIASDSVNVRVNLLPQIVSRLNGTEGSVSRVPKKDLAIDAEGDSIAISVLAVSPDLVFRLNASNDSVIYYLTNRDESGTRQAKITVVDQMNRTAQKVVNVVFAPLDDISGRVRDRFEGTYLAGYRPVVVMQGPYTGWVAAITGTETVKVPVDAGGKYAFPKLTSTKHTLRAFITNGKDSSFVATYQVSPGDRTFDIGVETNTGTGMPLRRLLSLYQTVNFRLRDTLPGHDCLVGMNLRDSASYYEYYLLNKNILSLWLNSRSISAEQQGWLADQIQARCFAHLPPSNRPRIVKGDPNDTFPPRRISPYSMNSWSSYIIVYVDFLHMNNNLTVWDVVYDVVYDYARIDLNGGDGSTPPYGFSLTALVQMVGRSISGNGTVQDQYYNDKTTRAVNSVLEFPSIADMKLDWQVIFEAPKYNNNVEGRYFGMNE